MELDVVMLLELPEGQQRAASFHPLESTVAVAVDREILEYDLNTGAKLSSFRTDLRATHLLHLETNNAIVAAMEDGSINVWNLNEHKLHVTHVPSKAVERKPVVCAAVMKSQASLLYSKGTKDIQVFSLYDTDGECPKLEGHTKPVTAIVVNPRNDHCVSGSSGGVMLVHDTETGRVRGELTEHLEGWSGGRNPITALCFDCNGTTLVAGTSDGNLSFWDAHVGGTPVFKGRRSMRGKVVSIQHHPFLGCFFVLLENGFLTALFLRGQGSRASAEPIADFGCFRYHNIFVADRTCSVPSLEHFGFHFHSRANFALFLGLRSLGKSNQITILSIQDKLNPKTLLPCTLVNEVHSQVFYTAPKARDPSQGVGEGQQQAQGGELHPGEEASNQESSSMVLPEATFPSVILFTDMRFGQHSLSAHSLVSHETEEITRLRSSSEEAQDADLYRPIRLRLSKCNYLLIFFQGLGLSSGGKEIPRAFSICKAAAGSSASPLSPGRDGVFVGESEEDFVVLSVDGKSLRVDSLNAEHIRTNPIQCRFPSTTLVERVWPVPCGADPSAVMYYEALGHQLCFSRGFLESGLDYKDKFHLILHPSFHLLDTEKLVEVSWSSHPFCSEFQDRSKSFLCGVLTTRRAIVLNAHLELLSFFENTSVFTNRSCLWIGNSFVFNTDVDVRCLAADGCCSTLATTDTPNSLLCTVLQDRIVFASFLKEKTFLWHRGVGILEPLILGVLGVRSFLLSIPTENHETVRWKTSEALSSILSRFECKRISPVLVDRLLGAELFDLALELVVKAPARLVWSVRYSVAVRALRFDVALGILEEQLVANRQNHGETIDSSSPLFQYFMDLGAACAEYGQFTLAAKCFDKIGDDWALFEVFSSCQSDQGMDLLQQSIHKESRISPLECAIQAHSGRTATETKVGGSGGQFGVEENRVKVLGADLEGINLVDWPFEGVGSTAGQWGSVDVNQGDMIVGISSDGHPMKITSLSDRTLVDWLGSPKTMIHLTQVSSSSRKKHRRPAGGTPAEQRGKDGDADESAVAIPGQPDLTDAQAAARRSMWDFKQDSEDEWSDEEGGGKKKIMVVIGSRKQETGTSESLSRISKALKMNVKRKQADVGRRVASRADGFADDFGGSASNTAPVSAVSKKDKSGPKSTAGGAFADNFDSFEDDFEPGGGAGNEQGDSTALPPPSVSDTVKKDVSKEKAEEETPDSVSPPSGAEVGASSVKEELTPKEETSPSTTPHAAEAPKTSMGEQSTETSTNWDEEVGIPSQESTAASSSRGGLKLRGRGAGGRLSLKAGSASRPQKKSYDIAKNRDVFEAAMEDVNQARFADALRGIESCLQDINPDEDVQVLGFFTECIAYKKFLSLILHERSESKDADGLVRGAVCLALASQQETRPVHQVRCARLALTKSFAASCFGLAAGLLEALISKAPENRKPELRKRLEECDSHGREDIQGSLGPLEDLRFCMKSMQLIPRDAAFLKCDFCRMCFHGTDAGLRHMSKCPFCSFGLVVSFKP